MDGREQKKQPASANGQSPSGLAGSASSPVRGAFLRELRPRASLLTKWGGGRAQR